MHKNVINIINACFAFLFFVKRQNFNMGQNTDQDKKIIKGLIEVDFHKILIIFPTKLIDTYAVNCIYNVNLIKIKISNCNNQRKVKMTIHLGITNRYCVQHVNYISNKFSKKYSNSVGEKRMIQKCFDKKICLHLKEIIQKQNMFRSSDHAAAASCDQLTRSMRPKTVYRCWPPKTTCSISA
ncbi:hypothetical protein AGLY_007761 [Aphis glycines]|uniref:Uncharacterized protein n=1 Tax=Aphis glycines TaxID=307491 RepID=A0A6G0TQ82_APHGL|nr:hypothetical protein AGLY_007761 [Aphis glycines]